MYYFKSQKKKKLQLNFKPSIFGRARAKRFVNKNLSDACTKKKLSVYSEH